MQRYFNLNIERMGTDFSSFHAAECLSCVPRGSSLMTAIDKSARWDDVEFLLHGLLSATVGKELPFPWSEKETGNGLGVETKSVPLDQFKEWYENTQWKEVEDWRQTR